MGINWFAEVDCLNYQPNPDDNKAQYAMSTVWANRAEVEGEESWLWGNVNQALNHEQFQDDYTPIKDNTLMACYA